MRIITIVGARPQIIKASALSRAIRECFSDSIEETIVHTGQHYDENMSEVFFRELEIPLPKYNLAVGSGSHGVQTARMTEGIEHVLEMEKPHAVVLYGDTNSTLAGAIAASKIHIPVIHIEAGLRSFDKNMPEEINRIMCDHCSTLLFSPTYAGYNNLLKEGFSAQLHDRATVNQPNIYHCGDIMYDNTLYFSRKVKSMPCKQDIYRKDFVLCTIHRNNNTDDSQRLSSIFRAIIEISRHMRIVLPLHPRTKKMLPIMLGEDFVEVLHSNDNIDIIDPVSFLDMIYLETSASMIITDSGGVQKEAYFLKKPCIILRPQTEWVEIVENGNAAICDADFDLIVDQSEYYLENPPKDYPEIFGDGHAAEFMCKKILECI